MSSSTTPVGNHAESHNAAIPGTTATGHQGAGLDSLLPKAAGGAPARIYLNEKIVPYLLEGMKNLAREQPSNPLKVLGEFLIQKSNEIEEVQNNGH